MPKAIQAKAERKKKMGSVNKITIIGRLGADPEFNADIGSGLCKMRVATSEKFKDRNGNNQERTEWHNVTVWGNAAKNCANFLFKGREVYVEGKLESREYTDREGNNRKAWEINAKDVVFLSGSSEPRGTQGNRGNSGNRNDWGNDSNSGNRNDWRNDSNSDPIPF